MAGPYNPPRKNQALVIRVALADLSVNGAFKADPTIAAGDFKVKVDGASPVNLTTLPSVDHAGEVSVTLSLTAAEMNGDNVTIVGIDQTAVKEWADFFLCILTTA